MNFIKRFLLSFDDQLKMVNAFKEFISLNQFQGKELGAQLKKINAQKNQFKTFSFFQYYQLYLKLLCQHFQENNQIFQLIFYKVFEIQKLLQELYKRTRSIYKESKQSQKKNFHLLYKILIEDIFNIFEGKRKIKKVFEDFARLSDQKQVLKLMLKCAFKYFDKKLTELEGEIKKAVKKMSGSISSSKPKQVQNQMVLQQRKIDSKFFSSVSSESLLNSKQKREIDEISQDLLSNENQDLISMANTLNQQLSHKSENSFKFKAHKINIQNDANKISIQSNRMFQVQSYKNIQNSQNEYEDQNSYKNTLKKQSTHNFKFLKLNQSQKQLNSRKSLNLQIKRKQFLKKEQSLDQQKQKTFNPFLTKDKNLKNRFTQLIHQTQKSRAMLSKALECFSACYFYCCCCFY